MNGPELRTRYRDLVERRLPAAAGARPDWPVRLDHCFARILLDNACGHPWREAIAPPAWRNTPESGLAEAVALGEAVLAGRADLAALNRRSLQLRRKGGASNRCADPSPLRGGTDPRVQARGPGGGSAGSNASDAPCSTPAVGGATRLLGPLRKGQGSGRVVVDGQARRPDG